MVDIVYLIDYNVHARNKRQVIKMKRDEIKAMVEETSEFVDELVRKVPDDRSEELSYLVTMALLFHEIAQRQQKTPVLADSGEAASALT